MGAGRFVDDHLRLLVRLADDAILIGRDHLRPADLLWKRRTHLLDELDHPFLAEDTVSKRQPGAFADVALQFIDDAVDRHEYLRLSYAFLRVREGRWRARIRSRRRFARTLL